VRAVIKCPYCNCEADASAFKLLRDPWNFRFYTAKMLERPRRYLLIAPRATTLVQGLKIVLEIWVPKHADFYVET